MTDEELIQKHARDEVMAAWDKLELLRNKLEHPSGGYQLKYDEVNDIADFLKAAAWRLKP